MSKKSNQKFVSVPHDKLRWMLSYKVMVAGIDVIWQEESYTSKADCTAGDFIPVYGKVEGHPVFSGRRVERGLYILRKAFPDAWAACGDYHFLAAPDIIGFKDLNPAVFPDRQRQQSANKKN